MASCTKWILNIHSFTIWIKNEQLPVDHTFWWPILREKIPWNFHTSLRSHLKNSCFVFHQGFQTPRNNKSTRPAASCFHLFLGVWNPWWNTRTRFWYITSWTKDLSRIDTVNPASTLQSFPSSLVTTVNKRQNVQSAGSKAIMRKVVLMVDTWSRIIFGTAEVCLLAMKYCSFVFSPGWPTSRNQDCVISLYALSAGLSPWLAWLLRLKSARLLSQPSHLGWAG